ncbi:AAA domain-containing protein [Earliella scabrosa]|nr:AAA domain-containing protein [Earliella scabrosa]
MSQDLALRAKPAFEAVFVLGPSSSGKTTLCEALASALHIPPAQYIKEVARAVMKTHRFTRDDTDTYEMQHAIMAAQLRAEQIAMAAIAQQNEHGLILSDRSAVDPIVYAGTSTASGAEERRQRLLHDDAFRTILPFYQRSLFVVLEPVVEWIEDDGVRSLEDPWRYARELKKTLDNLAIPYIALGVETKDLLERVELVTSRLFAAAVEHDVQSQSPVHLAAKSMTSN